MLNDYTTVYRGRPRNSTTSFPSDPYIEISVIDVSRPPFTSFLGVVVDMGTSFV